MKQLTLLLAIFLCSVAFSNTDSLFQVYQNNELPDSTRIDALNGYIWKKHMFSSADSAVYYAKILEKLCLQSGDKGRLAVAYNTMGTSYYFLGDFDIALVQYEKMGKLLDYYPGNKGEAVYYGNLANIYFYQENYTKSLESYLKVVDIFHESGMQRNESTTWNNIGNIYIVQEKYDAALEAYNKSLSIREETQDSIGLAATYSDLAETKIKLGNHTQAFQNYHKSLSISRSIGCSECLANSYMGLGKFHLDQKHLDSSLYYAKKGYELSKNDGRKLQLLECVQQLYETYKGMGKYKDALNMHEEYLALKDSISNTEHQSDVIRNELKYQFAKEAAADSVEAANQAQLKDMELAAQQSENKRQKQKSYFLLIGFGISMVFGIFIFNRFRTTRKQKSIIEEQKVKVDMAYEQLGEKNQEILDSITYAKRIQTAILPSAELVDKFLPQSFILYIPKDIVAGDFYWLQEDKGKVLFAAADCTGHGVPGAMVSVVCNNALNRAVREYGLTDPGEILDEARSIISAEFSKNNENVKDGMDIALCCIENNQLSYAGAINPVWVYREGTEEIIEFRGDRQAVGITENPQPFTTHVFDLQKGDTVYVFTDGFVDQFGGDKGKKYKSANFKKFLSTIQQLPIKDQEIAISDEFNRWRGELEQIDDVCVIGVRV